MQECISFSGVAPALSPDQCHCPPKLAFSGDGYIGSTPGSHYLSRVFLVLSRKDSRGSICAHIPKPIPAAIVRRQAGYLFFPVRLALNVNSLLPSSPFFSVTDRVDPTENSKTRHINQRWLRQPTPFSGPRDRCSASSRPPSSSHEMPSSSSARASSGSSRAARGGRAARRPRASSRAGSRRCGRARSASRLFTSGTFVLGQTWSVFRKNDGSGRGRFSRLGKSFKSGRCVLTRYLSLTGLPS